MKLEAFEAQGRARWDRFARILAALERGDTSDAAELPALYRQLCHDLALARERQLSGALVAELNELALALLAWAHPDLIYSFIAQERVAEIEQMYESSQAPDGGGRDSGDDATMFGFYIWNNVSIAFRTFASGLAFGVGTLLSVILNALQFGLISSHLVRVGSAEPFFSFVVGHGAFELTAILLAGAAGMRLGLAVLAPGPRSRVAALRAAALGSLPIIAGAALMLVIAAAIEAFWSPRLLPAELKYAVGAALWLLVALWLGLAGRSRAD